MSVSIPHINVKDHDTRRILQPMKETIEAHEKTIVQQNNMIIVLQNQLNTLTKKVNAAG